MKRRDQFVLDGEGFEEPGTIACARPNLAGGERLRDPWRWVAALVGSLLLASQPHAQSDSATLAFEAEPGVLSYSTHWEKGESESALAAFHFWANRFIAASNAANRPQMLAEGVELAGPRRAAFAKLLQSDPARALAETVPASVREQLPAEVLQELETRVSGVGDYSVLMADPYRGGPTVETLRRVVRLNGRAYRARVYGRRLGQTTKHGIPLHGVALDGVLALHEAALRQLEPDESPGFADKVTDLRPALEQTQGSSSTSLAETGGKLYRFSSVEQIQRAEARLETAEAGIGPNPAGQVESDLKASAASSRPSGTVTPRAAASSWTTGNKNVLIIRVDFSDLPGDPHDRDGLNVYTAAYCQNVADTQISPYYQQSSYGLTTLSNTVTAQLYRMPQPGAYYATNNANDELHLDAETAAAADYTISNFDRVIVLFSALDNLNSTEMNYGGLSTVGGENVWANGEFDFRIVAHELGHTYGLFHANLWLVNDGNPISPWGVNQEYGDEFDTMGANFGNDRRTDFNPWFKNLLGWIPDSQVQTITNSGTYRINRFDDSPGTGTLALKFPKDRGTNYWVALRRNFTDNPSLEHGAYVIWGYDFNRQSDLLDLTTPGLGEQDAALAVGASFTDPDAQITISPVAEGGVAPNEYLDVQIMLPPVFTLQSVDHTVMMGKTSFFSVGAAGDPSPGYQWQGLASGGTFWIDLTDNATYGGSATPTLRIDPVTVAMDGDEFRCVLSNSYATVFGSPATLSVNLFSLTGSGDQTVKDGQVATFSVVAQFQPEPTFQWQRLASGSTTWLNLTDNGNYTATGTSTLQVTAPVWNMNGDQFRCTVCTAYGCLTSSPAMLRLTDDVPLMVTTLSAQGNDGNVTRFMYPAAVAVDGAGAVYVAVAANHTIQAITRDGVVGTLAGQSGIAGDKDGVGGEARFNSPSGLAVDSGGNVYVADTLNSAIRKITPGGRVTTLAGRLGVEGSKDGLSTNSNFNRPGGLALDSTGNIYVADTFNETIRKISPAGMVSTLAGSAGLRGGADAGGSEARFNWPGGVAVDGNSNVYVADSYNNTIRKITPDGAVVTLAGRGSTNSGGADGIGTNASFSHPLGVAVDGAGNVYVADTLNSTIRKISPAATVSTIAGAVQHNGNADGTNAFFNQPAGLVVDNAGNIFIADTGNATIRQGIPFGGQPVITSQPRTPYVSPGIITVSFSVGAVGNGRLAYQWQKDGINLRGATNEDLLLSGVSHLVAGAYSVTVSNALGRALSQSALLRLPAPQQLTAPVRLGQGLVQLSFRDESGSVAALNYAQTYFTVQASTNLVEWQTLTGQFASSNGLLFFTQSGPTMYPPPSQRFYRIRGE